MKALILLLCVVVFASAGWNDATNLLKGPVIVSKSSKGKVKKADLSQKQPITLTITKKLSSRWIVTVPAKGTFILTKNGKEFRKIEMDKGKHLLKLFLEPGTYVATSTSGGTVQLMKFTKVKMVPLSPADGGIPVSVSNARHAYTYFKVGNGINPVLKTTGPATANIFVRVPANGKKQTIDVTVTEGSKVITHRVQKVATSPKLFIVDPKIGVKGSIVTPKAGEKAPAPTGTRLTDAMVINFSVPEGTHSYTVKIAGSEGILKFYRSKASKKAAGKKKDGSASQKK